jgi:hypothetical protein
MTPSLRLFLDFQPLFPLALPWKPILKINTPIHRK